MTLVGLSPGLKLLFDENLAPRWRVPPVCHPERSEGSGRWRVRLAATDAEPPRPQTLRSRSG